MKSSLQSPVCFKLRVLFALFLIAILSQFSACSSVSSKPEMPLVVQPTAQLPDVEVDQGLSTETELSKADDTAEEQSFLEEPEAETKDPLTFTLVNAFYEGDSLVVQGVLETFKELAATEVLVGVFGLREGNVIERQMKPFSEVSEKKSLEKGSRTIVRFELLSPEVSEYQLYSAWGEIAKAEILALSAKKKESLVVAKSSTGQETSESLTEVVELSPEKIVVDPLDVSKPLEAKAEAVLGDEPEEARARLARVEAVGSTKLLLENVEFKQSSEDEGCEKGECPLVYSMDAFLRNNSKQAITNVVLAMGLFWQEDGQSSTEKPSVNLSSSLEENEESIELGRLSIAPGESRRMRIAIDRDIPEVPGGSFVPRLRVISFSELAAK